MPLYYSNFRRGNHSRVKPLNSNLLHSKGSSTLDHIFAPVRMDVLQTGVVDKGISDHAAITAVTHIKRLPKDNFVKTRDVHKTWFDVGSAVRELHDGKKSINDLSFEQLVEGTMGKIKKHLYILPKKKKKTQKPWFSQFLVEAREHMFLMKRTGSHLQYQLARTSFHYFCKQAQQSYKIDQVEQLLRKPKGKQYLDIFQTYKKSKDKACTIDL